MTNGTRRPIHIALIDDDSSVRKAVSRLLRSHDYACSAYESAESALDDPALPSMQCLVIDVQLSGMSGFAFRDRLQQAGIRIPSLFITGHADLGSREWAQSLGDTPCVQKPFDEGQLLSVIEGLLQHREPASAT
jgi:FixJ family two-component response regulator